MPLSAAGRRARERGDRANVHPWGGDEDGGRPGSAEGGLPDIGDLTITTGRDPREAYDAARAQLGLEPHQRRDDRDGLPDVSGWRDELGLG